MALEPFWGLGHFFSFLILYTVGRTFRKSDQPVALPLPTHRTTQTQNKRTQYSHALSGIQTHDPRIRASEDSSCLRPRSHCERLAFERAKTVHALDRAATVIGGMLD
jgi:hypothetical protein